VIAPGCAGSTSGITVAADNVKIADLRIIGFTDYGIDIQGRDKVTVQRVMTLANGFEDVPLAGVHIATSTRVKLDDGWIASAIATPDAPAIHLADLAEHANVKLKTTLGGDHAIGMLIENCAPRSVVVSHCYANFNVDAGIVLRNSDGIVVKGSQVQKNDARGIAVEAGSDDNRLVGNDIGGSPTDVSDAGSGNCWKNNGYETGSVPGCP
jgi:parallel beta-helix repeat protein